MVYSDEQTGIAGHSFFRVPAMTADETAAIAECSR